MAYDVHLEVFEGPLDLLLYLIKKDDMEIAEIPIAQITQEYITYIDVLKELNLEGAGDFLVMASTLMQIKARMLLPGSVGEEEEESPLEELKARLLEYQRFKEVAQLLGNRETEYSQIFYRPGPVFDKSDFTLEVSLFDLISSFREVLTELPTNVREIVYEEIPIEQKIREILDYLEGKEFITFRELLALSKSRIDLIVSFLAVLELIRLKQVLARQKEVFGEVRLYRITAAVESVVEETENFEAPAVKAAADGQEELDFQKNSAGQEQPSETPSEGETAAETAAETPVEPPVEPAAGSSAEPATEPVTQPVTETAKEPDKETN